MSSRHSRRSNGRLTVYASSASAGPPAKRPCQSVVAGRVAVVASATLAAEPGERRAGGRRAPSPVVLGSATHSSVSSPATVPSRPSSPLRSSAEATTWAQPGGVRRTTRLAEAATSADPLAQHPAQLVERREAVGLELGQRRRRSARPAPAP